MELEYEKNKQGTVAVIGVSFDTQYYPVLIFKFQCFIEMLKLVAANI